MKQPFLWIYILCLTLGACSNSPAVRAPIVDNSRDTKPKTVKVEPKSINTPEKDWRPEEYIVKKGDTLYSIGLNFGYDYKEIAQNNHIQAPYNIYVGQKIIIQSKEKSAGASNVKKTSAPVADSEVSTKPIETDNTNIKAQTLNADSPVQANSPNAGNTNKSATTPSNQVASDDALTWSWPTQGRLITNGSEGAIAKGIDIDGKMGQDILAAAEGKVIYSGSDLRGYGNLVIIKHNKEYLSVYAHNSKIIVKEGQAVTRGQKIAEMGNSGADAVKLHFEIRYQGRSVDPSKFLGPQ
jgi:lipoprotein NlpD